MKMKYSVGRLGVGEEGERAYQHVIGHLLASQLDGPNTAFDSLTAGV